VGRLRLLGLAAVCVLVLAACGGKDAAAPDASGQKAADAATLWVTRDRGAELLVEATVPAGLTALQALDRETDVETRYGGRFVQSVNGIAGSVTAQEDWFLFVNGIEPSLGGAEVTLHPGDVLWWDYRDWGLREQQPVAVGAFPEPFLHGWEGKRRPAEVRAPDELRAEADALLAVLGGADGDGEPNVFELVPGSGSGATLTARRGGENDAPVVFTLAGSAEAVAAAARALAEDPSIVARRYEARFDDSGRVVG
jgi:hypothetical protein